ncbi:MAG TPA: hypothetical protein VNZ45_01645 [Bacteroidia bacterium]|jgi:hypothetical protein|nr:hypothetical protein [Bacteroidia bacterium]
MTAPELEDALVEFIAMNTGELKYRSNITTNKETAPRVYAAFIPRNQVGEIIPGEISSYPAVIVRARQGVEGKESERVTVELLIGTFDDTKDQQGSRDCLNLLVRIKSRIREQKVIRQMFPLRYPLNWQINKRASAGPSGDYSSYPYFFGEMQIDFELPVIGSQYEIDTMTPEGRLGRFDIQSERE